MSSRFLIRLIGCALVMLLTAGCNPFYIAQAASGQAKLLSARRPVTEVVADQDTDAQLRRRLDDAMQALAFAHDRLGLPDNGSYRDYVQLDQPYVVWNVFAAPEFSLALHSWCFPVAGCVAYRGYFRQQKAQDFAASRARRGDDTYVGGAAAYSTLGYFRDPLLSSLVRLPDTTLAGLIFHELAHQQVYAPGDTVFNESFATLVEQEGMVRWFEERGDRDALCRYLNGLERRRQLRILLEQSRTRLRTIYRSGQADEDRRAAKAAEIQKLQKQYQELRAGWDGPPYFDGWFDGSMNNARLGAMGAYDQLVGTLRVILEGEGGDLAAFYHRARRLARLSVADRAEVLGNITTPSERQPPGFCLNGS